MEREVDRKEVDEDGRGGDGGRGQREERKRERKKNDELMLGSGIVASCHF